MQRKQFLLLVCKEFSEGLCPAEQAILDQLLADSPEFIKEYRLLKAYWNHKHSHNNRDQVLFQNLLSKIEQQPKRSFFRFKLPYVAAFISIGLLIGGTLIWNEKKDYSIVTGRDMRTITLEDGTVVILNAKSTLFYPASFAADSREVKLTGEAFFNVAKEKERPFIIKTEHANLKVLGTKFNVRAYPDDATMETSLIEGSLEVRENESNHPIILHPSEKAVITNRNTSSSITRKKTTKLTLSSISYFTPKDSVAIETTWLANKMVFKNTSFDELSKVLERKYDVQFIFGSKRASKLRLTANFGQEGLEQILLALKIAAPFNYKREDNRIIITD